MREEEVKVDSSHIVNRERYLIGKKVMRLVNEHLEKDAKKLWKHHLPKDLLEIQMTTETSMCYNHGTHTLWDNCYILSAAFRTITLSHTKYAE